MNSKLKMFWGEFKKIFISKEMSILPGHLAYYFLLSLIPIVTIIVYIAMNFNLPLEAVKSFIEKTFSSNVASLLNPMLNDFTFNVKTLMILIVALFFASNGAKSIITASNTVFNIKSSGVIKKRVKAILISILLIILFTFILVVPLFGKKIILLFSFIRLDNEVTLLFNILYPVLKYPLSLIIIFFIIKMIYTIAPDEKIPSSYVNKGSIFTTIFWILSTTIFSFYINNVVHYDKLYGSLAGIIILLIYFYLLAYIFVIGLVLNFRNAEQQAIIENTIKLDAIGKQVKEFKDKNHKKLLKKKNRV